MDVAPASGYFHALPATIDPAALWSLFTRAGGEKIEGLGDAPWMATRERGLLTTSRRSIRHLLGPDIPARAAEQSPVALQVRGSELA